MVHETFTKKKPIVPMSVIVGIIIVLAVIRLCCIFSLRDGHHVDETWSYGFANSYYDPHIYVGEEKTIFNKNVKNIEEWISGDTFRNYISVSEDHRFDFGSVLYNKSDDLSPALYELALHFVCSFFPGYFSWNIAFFINVVFFVFTLILVYSITHMLGGSRFAGCLCIVFYALSGCGTACFLYLRVYSFFTLFTLLLFYGLTGIFKTEKDEKKKRICFFIILPIATLLGSLTHYYYLIVAFFLTLFTVILLLIKKRISDFFKVGLTMLFSVILFFVAYSPAFKMLSPFFFHEQRISESSSYSYPYLWELSLANARFFNATLGYSIRFSTSLFLYLFGIVFITTSFSFLIIFLFRNEEWMKRFLLNAKSFFKCACSSVYAFFKTINPMIWVILLSMIPYMLILPKSVSLISMGFIERYFFPLMSLFIIAYITIFGLLIKRIYVKAKKSKALRIISILLFIFVIAQGSFSSLYVADYKFSDMGESTLKEELSGKDCYVLIHAFRDSIWLSSVLYESNNVYLDYSDSRFAEDYPFPELDKDCLLVINTTDFLTEKQAAELEEGDEFVLDNYLIPPVLETADEFVAGIEVLTGNKYVCFDEFETFIGVIRIYRCEG